MTSNNKNSKNAFTVNISKVLFNIEYEITGKRKHDLMSRNTATLLLLLSFNYTLWPAIDVITIETVWRAHKCLETHTFSQILVEN